MVKAQVPKSDCLGLKLTPQFSSCVTLHNLTSPCLSLLICKMGVIIADTS